MYMRTETAFTGFEQIVLSDENGAGGKFTKTGLVAGTFVETGQGWRPVEELSVGDRVASFDSGFARIIGVRHDIAEAGSPKQSGGGFILVPGGVLDNCSDILLPVDQKVRIDCSEAEQLLGEPGILLPAAALVGFRGICHISPDTAVRVVNLTFGDEEIIYANTGVQIYCGAGPDSGFFTGLSFDHARSLLSLMERDLGFLSPVMAMPRAA